MPKRKQTFSAASRDWPSETEAYVVFCGAIDQAAVQRIFQGVADIIANKQTHIHCLFQSTGGFIAEGVCLYNFFRTLPIHLTLYNAGSVQSIATIAYLGAERRKTSARATFLIHRSHNSPQFATASRLQAAAESLHLDDQRTESILRDHVQLTTEQWHTLNHHDLTFSGEEAVALGFADEIGEFAPPRGARLRNL